MRAFGHVKYESVDIENQKKKITCTVASGIMFIL